MAEDDADEGNDAAIASAERDARMLDEMDETDKRVLLLCRRWLLQKVGLGLLGRGAAGDNSGGLMQMALLVCPVTAVSCS